MADENSVVGIVFNVTELPRIKRTAVIWMALAVSLSALGMAAHTVREFGYAGLFSLSTGLIPVVAVQLILFAVWWMVPAGKSATAIALAITALLQLIGGAIISVLPLPFLPFEPEQSVAHYISHVVLGVTQIPLVLFPFHWRKNRPVSQVKKLN